jgi:hypothetical protein
MKLRSNVFYCYALFVIIFSLLSFIPTPAKATLMKYHLQPVSLRLLDLTLLIPMFIMWFAAFYGYERLHLYGQLIKSNQDGKQVTKLADGLLVLATGESISSIVSSSLQLIARQHSAFASAATVISNYVNVLYPLVAFILIARAARGLSELSKTRPGPRVANAVIVTVIILGVGFCDLIARSHHSLSLAYHMSYQLVMLTLATPYMYVWFLGLFAIAELYAYSKQIAGILYRKGWDRLVFGLGMIIVIDILLQYLGTLSSWLNGLSLSGLLLLLYVLLLGLASAYIVVALGTKELMKIEEA